MNAIKTKLFPLSLVIILSIAFMGLSSWRAPQTKKGDADTTKTKKQSSQSSKRTIITIDENGNAHERIIEDFEGDEDINFNFDFPSIPDLDIDIPDFPEIPAFNFNLDSGDFQSFRFDGDWDRFEDSFKDLTPEMQAQLEAMSDQLEKMDFHFDEQLNQNFDGQMKQLEESLKNLDFNLEKLNELDLQFDQLKKLEELEEISNDYADQLKSFERAAEEELIKDGYLKKGEKLESINWSDDEIEFNGTAIKKEHVEKYRELQHKYMRRQWRGRIE